MATKTVLLFEQASLNDIEAILSKLLDDKLSNLNIFQPSKSKEPVKYLTRKETAAKLRISLPTLSDWTRQGLIKSKRIGSRILYDISDVESAIKYRR